MAESHIQASLHTCTMNIICTGGHAKGKLSVLPPMAWIPAVVCVEDHRYVEMEMILSS